MVETSYFQSFYCYMFPQQLPSHTFAVAMSLYQIRSQLDAHTETISCLTEFAERDYSKGYKIIRGGQARNHSIWQVTEMNSPTMEHQQHWYKCELPATLLRWPTHRNRLIQSTNNLYRPQNCSQESCTISLFRLNRNLFRTTEKKLRTFSVL